MSVTRKCFLIRLLVAILLAGLLPSSGCSVLLHTAGDPFGYEPIQGPPRCMRAPVGPVVDFIAVLPTFLAGALVGAAEAWGNECEEEPCAPVDHSTSSKIMLTSGGLLLSGVYGIVQTSRCHEAYERHRAHQAAVKATPGGRRLAGGEMISFLYQSRRSVMAIRPVHHASCSIVSGVLAGLLLASGCSVLLSHAPIHYEPNRGPPECMSAPVGPVLDLLAVPGAFLIGTVVNALEDIGRYCDDDGYCDPPASEGNKWFLVAGGLAASSVYGFVQTGRCNAAHERYRDYRTAGGVTLAPEPEPVSSICRVWQRRYRAATAEDEKREVMRKAAPECRALLNMWPPNPRP